MVLLSALVKRFFVSRMRNLKKKKCDICAMIGVYRCDRHLKGGMGHGKCGILVVSHGMEYVDFV